MEWKRIELFADSQNPPVFPMILPGVDSTGPSIGPCPPDLAELISLWPLIPEDVRSSVLVLVRAGTASARPPAITPRKAAG